LKKETYNVGMDNVRILSFGGGVNSVAILVLLAQGKIAPVDVAIFADTGCEMPETYTYIEKIVKPFCKTNNINFTTIKNQEKTLLEHCQKLNLIPSRQQRWCTDKWKTRTIRKYLLTHYPNATKITQLIGYAHGKEKRANKCKAENPEYPLIKLKITRRKCKNIIRNAGLPVPVKSGCFLCPQKQVKEWIRLYKEHPNLYHICEQLELNSKCYPTLYLNFPKIGTLHNLRQRLEAGKKLPKLPKSVQTALFCSFGLCEVYNEENCVDYSQFDSSQLTSLVEATV
jgi:hypothetical protein